MARAISAFNRETEPERILALLAERDALLAEVDRLAAALDKAHSDRTAIARANVELGTALMDERARISAEVLAEAVRGLPDDCHSEEGSCYCGSDLNPDTSVSRAAVLAVVEGDR